MISIHDVCTHLILILVFYLCVRADARYTVAIVGGGPAGSSAAEIFAQEKGIDTVLFERKMDNAKPCGGAIPHSMIGEFDIPESVVDRKVRLMKLISPSNIEVEIGDTLNPNEYLAMCRREVLDSFLRDRAISYGAEPIQGLVTSIDVPEDHENNEKQYTIHYQEYAGGPKVMKVDLIIGADGANSRVAKAMGAGEYNFAIAFQERIKIPDDKMQYYEESAEMYFGDDISPDLYGWVFPKYDHVIVGTATIVNRPAIKEYQKAIRDAVGDKISGGKFIKVEAHPIPAQLRPRRVQGRMCLVGDAAGYVTSLGEGLYFAAKSGRMAAESIVELMNNGNRLPTQAEIELSYIKSFDDMYGRYFLAANLISSMFMEDNNERENLVQFLGCDKTAKSALDAFLYKDTEGANAKNIHICFQCIAAVLSAILIPLCLYGRSRIFTGYYKNMEDCTNLDECRGQFRTIEKCAELGKCKCR